MIFSSGIICASSSSSLEQSVVNNTGNMANEAEDATAEFRSLRINSIPENEAELPLEVEKEINKIIPHFSINKIKEDEENKIALFFNKEKMILLELTKNGSKNGFLKKIAEYGIDKSKSELEKIKEQITLYFEILKTDFIPDIKTFFEMRNRITEMNSEERKNEPNYHLYNFLFDTYNQLRLFFETNPEDASLLTAKYIDQIPFLFGHNDEAMINFKKFCSCENRECLAKFFSDMNEDDRQELLFFVEYAFLSAGLKLEKEKSVDEIIRKIAEEISHLRRFENLSEIIKSFNSRS